jgi:hypothetical protein
MKTPYTHPKDCADQKEATADRRQHERLLKQREQRQQILAHAGWFSFDKRP